MSALSAEARAVVDVIRACIAAYHVVEVDYTDLHLKRETLRVRPAVIAVNSASHVVLWCMPVDVDEWRELLIDRIGGVRDTGEVFTPAWQEN